MEIKIDPQNSEQRFNCAIRLVEKSSISDKNKRIILKFKDSCVRDGLSKVRMARLLGVMNTIAIKIDKDFDKVTKRDIENFITEVQQRECSIWTKNGYMVIIKKFYKWYKGNNETYPNEVKWIKTKIKKKDLKLPTQDGLITEDDVKILVNGARSPRDKAFISLLYESGCRVSELLTLRLNNVIFDEYGALLNVYGKTGSRKIRILASTSYLVTWVHCHPFKDDTVSPLWINEGQKSYNNPMRYSTVRAMLQKLFKRCNIRKKFNPHLFRHSRATYLANHLTEFQMNKYFGWVPGSNMSSTYVHLSGRDTDASLLALHGMKSKEDNESKLKPIKCVRCDNINSYDSKFCSKCAGILSIETAMKLEEKRVKEFEVRKESDDLMNKLIRDPDVQRLLMEKMTIMGLNK